MNADAMAILQRMIERDDSDKVRTKALYALSGGMP